MARTFGAMLFYGAANLNFPLSQQGTGAGQFTWIRNGLGDFSITGPGTAAAGTLNAFVEIADFKRPYITFPAYPGQGTVPSSNEFQELFGTAAGGPGNPMSGGTLAFSGTPAIPWGLAIIDVFAVYSVQTGALTTATLSLNRVTYTENAAFTNTNVLAATAIALTTTTGAGTPHVQKVALAQPLVYEVNDISDLLIEGIFTTSANANSFRLYGMGCHCAVEFS